MTTNEETLRMLRNSIYLQTVYENSKNGKIVWSQIDKFTFHARESEPATTCLEGESQIAVRHPRRIWDFYLVRVLVNGEPKYVLDVLRNGDPLYSFDSDVDTTVVDIFGNVVEIASTGDDMVDSIRALENMTWLSPPTPGSPYLLKARSHNFVNSVAEGPATVDHAAVGRPSARSSNTSRGSVQRNGTSTPQSSSTMYVAGRIIPAP